MVATRALVSASRSAFVLDVSASTSGTNWNHIVIMANNPMTRQRPNQKSLRRTIGLMGPEPAQWSGNAWLGELSMYQKQNRPV
jgi:hypothetical protein